MPFDTELLFRSDFGTFRPGPFTSKLLAALEANMPKRRTKLSKAIESVIYREMQTRAHKHWEAGGDVSKLETP